MKTATGTVLPPIQMVSYQVVVNCRATGSFDKSTLNQMAYTRSFTKNSLVWKQGMTDWVKSSSIEELNGMFGGAMSPIPPEEK